MPVGGWREDVAGRSVPRQPTAHDLRYRYAELGGIEPNGRQRWVQQVGKFGLIANGDDGERPRDINMLFPAGADQLERNRKRGKHGCRTRLQRHSDKLTWGRETWRERVHRGDFYVDIAKAAPDRAKRTVLTAGNGSDNSSMTELDQPANCCGRCRLQ